MFLPFLGSGFLCHVDNLSVNSRRWSHSAERRTKKVSLLAEPVQHSMGPLQIPKAGHKIPILVEKYAPMYESARGRNMAKRNWLRTVRGWKIVETNQILLCDHDQRHGDTYTARWRLSLTSKRASTFHARWRIDLIISEVSLLGWTDRQTNI